MRKVLDFLFSGTVFWVLPKWTIYILLWFVPGIPYILSNFGYEMTFQPEFTWWIVSGTALACIGMVYSMIVSEL